MIRPTAICVVTAIVSNVLVTGCMPKMTVAEMKAMMPQRPAELDRLNAFVGRWEFNGEAKMANMDEVLRTSGTNEAKWDGDQWFLVSRGVFGMGDLGEMTGLETWTYDAHAKVYRSTWVDSMGSTGTGTSRYDEKADTWHMRACANGPYGKVWYTGSVSFTDPDTMQWSWSEYALWGLMKTMEMSGTSRRQ